MSHLSHSSRIVSTLGSLGSLTSYRLRVSHQLTKTERNGGRRTCMFFVMASQSSTS